MGEVNQYQNHCISAGATARDALKILDQLPDNEIRALFVVEGKKLVGTLTDGDIRRGLLKDREISESVSLYMNRNYKSLKQGEVNPENISRLRKMEIYFVPVLNEDLEITEVLNLKTLRSVLPAAALIMAGGRGERLRPLTESVPKPMLKVGDKPIIEINIDRLIQYGIKKFYISIKYLGDKIVEHFGDGSSKGVTIEYLREEEPLGTLGACTLIKSLDYRHLLVMNSDILTNIDFEDFFEYYQSSGAEMCTASIPYKVNIPYGIMEMNREDLVTGLVEKPTYTYYANAGIYFISAPAIAAIPKGVFYNATDLMQQLINGTGKLVHYPILQYWLDIGKYEDYIRAQHDFKHINF